MLRACVSRYALGERSHILRSSPYLRSSMNETFVSAINCGQNQFLLPVASERTLRTSRWGLRANPSSCSQGIFASKEHSMVLTEGYLTEEGKEDFEKNGYVVLPQFATEAECAEMRERMQQLVEGFEPSQVALFSTRNQQQLTNEYFFNSARAISFFFEENAFDSDGNLKQPKHLSINKVGHALHDLDPVFRSFSRSSRVAALLRSLGFQQPLPVQSMYIFKQPGIGGEVVPHQDSSFLYTDPLSCMGLWLALEDATEENGCLWALPGSHKGGLARRFVRSEGCGVKFDADAPQYDLSAFVPLPVARGSLVVLHGLLVHNSYENKSRHSRHAYSIHVIETTGCDYPGDNWLLPRPGDPPFETLTVT